MGDFPRSRRPAVDRGLKCGNTDPPLRTDLECPGHLARLGEPVGRAETDVQPLGTPAEGLHVIGQSVGMPALFRDWVGPPGRWTPSTLDFVSFIVGDVVREGSDCRRMRPNPRSMSGVLLFRSGPPHPQLFIASGVYISSHVADTAETNRVLIISGCRQPVLGRRQRQRLADSGGEVVVSLFDCVAVDAESDRRVHVPEAGANGDRVEPSGDPLRRREVPKSVQGGCRRRHRPQARPANLDTTSGRTGSVPAGDRENMNASAGTLSPNPAAVSSTDDLWRRSASSAKGSKPIVRTWWDFVPSRPSRHQRSHKRFWRWSGSFQRRPGPTGAGRTVRPSWRH